MTADQAGLRPTLATALEVCDCYPSGFSPETYEGPQRHCPAHGDGYAQADAVLAVVGPLLDRAEADRDALLEEVERQRGYGDPGWFCAKDRFWIAPYEHISGRVQLFRECPTCGGAAFVKTSVAVERDDARAREDGLRIELRMEVKSHDRTRADNTALRARITDLCDEEQP